MAKIVETIPALSMDRIDHKRVAAYACFDPEEKAGLRDRSREMGFVVKEVYPKPKWKLARLYWDYEPGIPVAERHVYQDFVHAAAGGAIDILYMWSIRQLSRDRDEIARFLRICENTTSRCAPI